MLGSMFTLKQFQLGIAYFDTLDFVYIVLPCQIGESVHLNSCIAITSEVPPGWVVDGFIFLINRLAKSRCKFTPSDQFDNLLDSKEL